MTYELGKGDLRVSVRSRGAELCSVLFRGRERLWQNETGEWNGHAPILFPVCGACKVRVGGKDYPLERHGFARRTEFNFDGMGEDFIAFSLRSDERTRSLFPYDFRFRVVYTVRENALLIRYEAEAPPERELNFFCGGHESFALDRPETCRLVLPEAEPLTRYLHDENGLVTGEVPLGRRSEIVLSEEMLKGGETLILGNLRAREVLLVTGEGKREARIRFDGFRHLLVWRPAGAKMLCVEPWQNLPDRAGEPPCEFSARAGIVHLAPGERTAFVRSVEYF